MEESSSPIFEFDNDDSSFTLKGCDKKLVSSELAFETFNYVHHEIARDFLLLRGYTPGKIDKSKSIFLI